MIAKETMKNDSNVYFDNPEIVVSEGGIRKIVIAAASIAIGLFGPMVVNLCLAAFNIADGKPLLKSKNK